MSLALKPICDLLSTMLPHPPWLSPGSRRSRRASPRKLNATTARKIPAAGTATTWGATRRYARPAPSMAPSSGEGGWAPSPRKLRLAPMSMFWAEKTADCTVRVGTQEGKMCRPTRAGAGRPETEPQVRPHRIVRRQPGRPPGAYQQEDEKPDPEGRPGAPAHPGGDPPPPTGGDARPPERPGAHRSRMRGSMSA